MTRMNDTPQIPTPAHTLAESMLSRRFGRETVNYFSSMAQCDMKDGQGHNQANLSRLAHQPAVLPAV